MNNLFTLKYEIEALCENCGSTTILRIPRGTYVYDFLKQKECNCQKCGCRVRKLLNDELNPKELEQEHKKELMSLRDRLRQKRVENDKDV